MSSITIGRYRHYKGNKYDVIGVATHSETAEQLVVYRSCTPDQRLFVRPLNMFAETVTVKGTSQPRFQKL